MALLFFYIQIIVIPIKRIFTNVFDMIVIVLLIPHNVIKETSLPNVFTVFLVTKALKR